MAYLHHDGITEEMFARAADNRNRVPEIPPGDEEVATRKYVLDHLEFYLDINGRWDSNAFSEVMDELVLYSLVDYDRVNEAYRLHVLVQDWTRTMTTDPKTVTATHTSHLLALSIDWSHDLESHAYRRGLLLHVSELLGKLSTGNANDALYFAKVYYESGRWQQAEQLQVQVVDARKQALGGLHPDTLRSMANLASTYWNQGRWDEAESLQVQVLDAKQQALGELHPDTLTSMNNLASTYRNQGRWDEAESLDVQVLDARKQALGELHPRTLTSMNNLASTYWDQGRWDEAESLQVQVLDARKQALGELHPDTLISMHNLALTYSYMGRLEDAEALQVQAVAANKRVFGETHRETLEAMESLASTYQKRRSERHHELTALEVEIRRLKEISQ
ncbi:hypothetical protein FRC07_005660 [Ceratobasidium sp. 392]|nr:hypothetical protein FRC07_005660 [Ceratobasidium sp. 392]